MGFGKKVKLKLIFRNSLCGMNVGLVYVLYIISRDVRFSLVSIILALHRLVGGLVRISIGEEDLQGISVLAMDLQILQNSTYL